MISFKRNRKSFYVSLLIGHSDLQMPLKNEDTERGTGTLLGRKCMPGLIVQISSLVFLSYV